MMRSAEFALKIRPLRYIDGRSGAKELLVSCGQSESGGAWCFGVIVAGGNWMRPWRSWRSDIARDRNARALIHGNCSKHLRTVRAKRIQAGNGVGRDTLSRVNLALF
jgi:hypothetical protein